MLFVGGKPRPLASEQALGDLPRCVARRIGDDETTHPRVIEQREGEAVRWPGHPARHGIRPGLEREREDHVAPGHPAVPKMSARAAG